MPEYVRIVHRGRGFNVRVELPDGSTRLISRDELSRWTQVERNPDARPFVRTRNTQTHEESVPDDRRYIRVLHRGRGQHTRLLLPDGTTCLVNTDDLPNWTYVGDNPNITVSVTPASRGFVNPENAVDRIYDRITRRGSRNTSVLMSDGRIVHVPNEFFGTWIQRGTSAFYALGDTALYPQGRGIEHLTFGIELEFIAPQSNFTRFCNAMENALGLERFSRPRSQDSLSYGRSSTTKWVLGYDRSVRPTRSGDMGMFGYELTSPILKWDDASKTELRTVLNLITTEFGGKVNVTCGTHVHVGNFCNMQSRDLFNKSASFQRNYGYFEQCVFDRLVSPSRRGNGNHYCQSCDTSSISGRYYKINTQNIFGFGTIENRQHQGTLEAKKILSWMELNGKYILAFFKDASRFNDHGMSMRTFFQTIGLSEETQQFFFSRDSALH